MVDGTWANAAASVNLGFHPRSLRAAGHAEAHRVAAELGEFIDEMDRSGFAYPRGPVRAVRFRLEAFVNASRPRAATPPDLAAELRTIIECARDTVTAQAGERRLAVLKGSAVTSKLRDYAQAAPLTARQTYLDRETVLSLETGNTRSAVVMGWTFAFDVVRQWVFDDAARLAGFNAELAKITDRDGTPRYGPVAGYPDFFEIGEAEVLDVSKGAGLIGGQLCDDLRAQLRQRTAYAYASDAHPSVHQANALIDHLIDAVGTL